MPYFLSFMKLKFLIFQYFNIKANLLQDFHHNQKKHRVNEYNKVIVAISFLILGTSKKFWED